MLGKRLSMALWRPWLVAGIVCIAANGLANADTANKRESRDDDPSDVHYQFGRPLRPGEYTYKWYRNHHAAEAAANYGLSADAVGDGMDTWHWWKGVDNDGFWRELAKLSGGSTLNTTNVKVDFFRMLLIPRAERFEKLGVINDPDAVAADGPDEYGLTIDRMKEGSLDWDPEVFGYSSGVIGLQLFKNKNFDASKWSLEKYLKDPASVEPPYTVGMACAFCHVSFDPTHPPKNPAEPGWENLASAVGNQYFREGMLFGSEAPHDSFVYQYLANQPRGTSETSRFPSDFINNPIAMNPIYRLDERLKLTRPEKITPAQYKMLKSIYAHVGLPDDTPVGAIIGTEAEPMIKTPHVLADGADSMGIVVASTRVYVNEGSGYKDWVPTWALNPWDVRGSMERNFVTQEFDITGRIRQDPNSPWMQTEKRMPNMEVFLSSYHGYPLSDAVEARIPGRRAKDGKDYQTTDERVLRKGKIAYADNCAGCHSSKKPDPMPSGVAAQREAWRQLVLRDDFLTDNYLSDDQRYPVSELKTNAARAMGTNAMAGHTWGQMSSQTYKDLKVPIEALHDYDASGAPKDLYNPQTGEYDHKFSGPKAFYRTPTLVSVWSRAPYLHNKTLGLFNGDPSVAGRMAAFQDGMEKLFWPERRRGVDSIEVTTQESKLPDLFPIIQKSLPEFADLPDFDASLLTVPKGTPVNLVMNLHPSNVKAVMQAYVEGILQGNPRPQFAQLQAQNLAEGRRRMIAKLYELNTCPDFIQDKGHYYGHDLSDEDKRALIEYMKYF